MSGRRKTQRASVRVRRLVALSGLVAGSMFSGAHPAAAGPQPTELHHNISGAELGQGSYRKTDWVKWAFNSAGSGSSRPLAISLNETCYNQAAELESWIQASHGLDYTLLFYAQKSGVGKCPAINGQGAGKYGVGVLTLGQHDTRAGQFASQEQGDTETRGYACSLGGASSPKYWFCTGHTKATFAQTQFSQYKATVDYLPATVPKLWAGDLYRSPAQISADFPGFFTSTNNREADICSSTSQARWTIINVGGTYQKWDYIFRRGSSCPTQLATLMPNPANSANLCSKWSGWGNDCDNFLEYDHRLVGGHFDL